MSERNPFQPKAPGSARTLQCEEWEALLADALDGSLPPGDSAAFQNHQESCVACMELLTRAKQGQEWLHFLHVGAGDTGGSGNQDPRQYDGRGGDREWWAAF